MKEAAELVFSDGRVEEGESPEGELPGGAKEEVLEEGERFSGPRGYREGE